MPINAKPSSCCTSRDPPSPDSLPPRPAGSSGSSARKGSKGQSPSWTPADTAQLHAIFEEDTITPPEEECLQLRPRQARGKLAAILEGDKSDSDLELRVVQVKSKKSSSTLKSITERLKKHLSKDSALSKRHSRSSVGTSEEEIERRAELRRIRERRIWEELSNEGVYDEDARSVSSLVGPRTSAERRIPSPENPSDDFSLLALKPPALSYPRISYPYLSPSELERDPLREYLGSLRDERRKSPPLASNATWANSAGSLSRRHSSPGLSTTEIGDDESQSYFPPRKRSSLPSMPASPMLRATRLPSIAEPVRLSWRLSFASDHRGKHLRKLSQGHAEPVTLSVEKLRDTLQPARHLHDNGLRSSSPLVTALEDNINLEDLASHSQTCSASQDFGGVDGVGDSAATLHLHEMGISQRLASQVQSSSSPQLSSWGSHERVGSNNMSASNVFRAERRCYMQTTSDSVPLSERIPQSWGEVVHGTTSSVYPSASNSLQTSRDSSRYNFSSFLQGSRDKTEAEDTHEANHSPIKDILRNVSAEDFSTSSLGLPLARYARRPTMDDSSLVASETESFRRMEAELSVVETRFASSEARRVPSTPISSKFREEFDLEPPPARPPQPRKKSAFSKLARLAIRSYDGAQNMEELLSIPVPDFKPALLTPGAETFNPLDDEAGGMWGKVLKKKGDSKAKDIRDRLELPRERSRQREREKSAVEEEHDRPKGAFEGILNLRKGKKIVDVSDHKSAAEEYQKRFEERIAVKELVMDSWEAEMEASAAKAKVKSRNIVRRTKPTGPDRRYPASWARFPNHNRSERLSSATSVDHVDAKDFANLGKQDGETVWCLAHEDDGHHTELEYLKRKKGVMEKIKARIEHELYRTDTQVQQSSSSLGRRGSLSVAGALEYPELEVLPLSMLAVEQTSEETEKEVRERERKLRQLTANLDGSVDVDSCEDLNASMISIADPKFYEDCLVDAYEEMDADMLEEMLPKIGVKKDKSRTWAGRDWDGYKNERRNRNMSLGSVFLRRSTDDHCSELEILEQLERKKVLKAADDAWGKRK